MVWLILEISGSARWQSLIHWNPWLILLAILPAWILSGAWSSDSGIRELLAHDVQLTKLALGADFVSRHPRVPAHLRCNRPGNWPVHSCAAAARRLACAGRSGVSFARNLLLTAVFEEPGWRDNLLVIFRTNVGRSQRACSFGFPDPVARTAGSEWRSGPPFTGWLQIRMAFLIPMTILLTWIYNRSRRWLVCTALFHAVLDTFPFVLPWSPPMLGLVFVFVFVWRSVPSRIVCGAATLSMKR
jgi:hypothetical protein